MATMTITQALKASNASVAAQKVDGILFLVEEDSTVQENPAYNIYMHVGRRNESLALDYKSADKAENVLKANLLNYRPDAWSPVSLDDPVLNPDWK